MNNSWTLSDVEFTALWADTKAGHLPSPLIAVSRVKDLGRYEHLQVQAQQRLRDMAGFEAAALGEVMAHPDIAIQLTSWNTLRPDDLEGKIRVYAARRGAAGVVVRQVPGETAWYSKGFVVIPCTAVELARVMMDQLPVARAGQLGEVVLVGTGEGLDYSYGRSAVRERSYAAEPPHVRAARFLDTPTERMGGIEILQTSSAFGPRGCTRYFLDWRDLVGDGRYLITDDTPPVATPVDTRRLVALVNTRIAAIVQAIRDERQR